MGDEQSETSRVPTGTPAPEAEPVEQSVAAGTPDGGSRPVRGGLVGPLLVYTALRLALIAVLTGLLMLFMPLIVALLFAIIVQLPLSYILFPGPRRRVNAAMAAASGKRRGERERLRAALAGDSPPADRAAD